MGKLNFQKVLMMVVLFTCLVIAGIWINSIRIIQTSENGSKHYTEDDKPMIGFSIDGMVIERWQKDINILTSKAEEYGFVVEVANAYENADKQSQQIKTLADEGALAIFILPYNKEGLSEAIEYAKDKDVIVIAYDRLINNADVDAYVSFDNVSVGEKMAQALIDEVPQGNYVIINGSPKDNNAFMFNDGFYHVLEPYIESGDITIIREVWSDNWREEYGTQAVLELLEEGVEIDAIIGANDRLAEGAISVLSQYGLVGSIPVVGHDADVSACQRIVEGKQLMTVYKPIKNLAEGSVDLVVHMLNNREIPADETIANGLKDVPYYKFDVISVHAENMDETVIKDLFHREDDIYRDSQDD